MVEPSSAVRAVLKPDMVRVPVPVSVEPGERTRPSILLPVPVRVAPSDSILRVIPEGMVTVEVKSRLPLR